ncbi:Granulocyte colony-stimulating factor receptor [Collichthys lucidus]|uniref:Granulocyte colony-stimulating factor receptor n=1 Tax=Collichthys lucidus TaxID=240159 RepID=A0A4U5V3L2_COLLU|nr:Granulocyte colony-stimulating factor receptor [Collichthys lucidus]
MKDKDRAARDKTGRHPWVLEEVRCLVIGIQTRGVALTGLRLPQSRGHGTYQRGLTGYGLQRKVPVLGSSGFTHKPLHVRVMTGRGPAVGTLKRIRFPGHLAQPLHSSLNVKRFAQGFIIMISTRVSVIVMLVAFVNGARNATCIIRDSCPVVIGQAVHIQWRLDNRFLPSITVANGSSRVSEVVIPSFNHTRGSLTCCVQASSLLVVGGVDIRAGYPPQPPQNLSCQTNLTTPSTLTCRWHPGQQETHLLTKYTLHTKIRDSNENNTYKLPPGVHQYTIPRSGFVLFSEIELYVKAVNDLGEATSVPITLEPVGAAKFDPPTILNIQAMPKRYGCLKLSWTLSEQQAWMRDSRLNLEVRLQTADSSRSAEQPILINRVKPTRPVDQCRLLHATQYFAQIRVRYRESPWSEWSGSQSGVTLESAPTGRLDWWMKASGDQIDKHLTIHLFWKPSKQFRANSRNVSYVVSLQKLSGEKGKVCSTMANYCTFQLPKRAKKVYLSAVNAEGRSNPTEVRITLPRSATVISDVTVIPQDDRSLLVQWSSLVSSSPIDFVVEWRPLLETDLSFTQFEIKDRNQTSLVISGSIEPYKPYGISVYPRFKDWMGLPQTVNAYSRQKAPSMVPKIRIKKNWQYHVELTWDELALHERNGNIQSYKIFYWSAKDPVKVVASDPEERRVVLKDLNTVAVYDAFMMVTTFGGSLNGSTIHFEVEPFVVMCFSKHSRLKGRFWPAVPDPANSSLKRWTSDSTQDTHLASDSDEPNPIYLSHLSFLDIPVKLGKEDDVWSGSPEDTSDLGDSICGSPFLPGYSGSNTDSVPYATVIFSGQYSSPPPNVPHVYLRSESTQPLLEMEESFSPKCYQNMTTDGMPREQCFFGPCDDCIPEEAADPAILWDDFPFLQALAMNEMQND